MSQYMQGAVCATTGHIISYKSSEVAVSTDLKSTPFPKLILCFYQNQDTSLYGVDAFNGAVGLIDKDMRAFGLIVDSAYIESYETAE